MLTMRQAPVSRAWRARSWLVMLSSRQIAVVRVRCRRAWSTRSSWASGCSIMSETVGVELAQEPGIGQGVGRVGVDGEAAIRGCRLRISATTATSAPGLILSLMRR